VHPTTLKKKTTGLKSTDSLQHNNGGDLNMSDKETSELTDMRHQVDLTMSTEYFIQQLHNIHSSYHPMELFPNIFRHKTSLSKCKTVEITPCILSDYNGIKTDINSKTNTENIQTQGD
jgi:hypothetical protein